MSAAAPSGARTLRVLVVRGLRDHRRAPLTWGGGLGAMGALMAAVWPSIEGTVDQLMRSYPEGLKKAFGIESLDSVERYIDAEMLSLVIPLVLGFFAVRCVASATVAAEERGFLDTLLSAPVARRVLVAAAFAVTGLVLAAVLAVIWAVTWVAGTIAGTGIDALVLGRGVANVWPLAMAFAGLAALLAGLVPGQARVVAGAFGMLVAMYVLDLVGKLSADLEPLSTVSAFRLYGSAIQDGLELGHVALLTGAGVALAAAGAVLFERRDVR